jgi:hypothetical protein
MTDSKEVAENIRIVSIEGENIRKLSSIAVRMDGEPGLFRATGKNESGKTTFLDCIAMIFGGKKAVKPDTIQEGKDGAWVRAELSNGYSIERRFTAAAPDGYLIVTTPDDMKPNSPQTILDGWCGPHSFDPGALLKKRTKDIEAIILGLASDPDLKKKREAISAKRETLTEERRPWNSQKQKAERTKRPAGTRPEAVDVSGEMENLSELRAAQQSWVDASRQAERAENTVNDLRAKLADAEKALKEASDELSGLSDVSEAIGVSEETISKADAINAELGPWNDWDRAQAEVNEATRESLSLTKRIKALDEEEDALLKAADIPVRGIGFTEDGSMVLDGHPIEVASGMRRLDMTCDIAFAANSGVRVVLLDEANDYGIEALENLHKRAREQGWQVVAGRLGIEGPGEIIIQDGAATT